MRLLQNNQTILTSSFSNGKVRTLPLLPVLFHFPLCVGQWSRSVVWNARARRKPVNDEHKFLTPHLPNLAKRHVIRHSVQCMAIPAKRGPFGATAIDDEHGSSYTAPPMHELAHCFTTSYPFFNSSRAVFPGLRQEIDLCGSCVTQR